MGAEGSGGGSSETTGAVVGRIIGAAAAQAKQGGAEEIYEAVRMRKCELALKLLRAKPEHWKAVDEGGHNVLHWCALVGSEELVAEAIRNRVPVDVKCNNGQTPMMWALTSGQTPIVRQLAEAGADLHQRDSLGATPLMIATQHTGHERYHLLMLLVHKGGQEALTDSDINGCTVVHWAAWKGDLTALKLLEGFSADLQALDSGGMTPLHRAVMACQRRVVPFLMEVGLDPKQKNNDGKTCFDMAQPCDITMERILRGEIVDVEPARDQDDGDGAWSDGGEEPKQGGSQDVVETFLDDIQASWLTPYYHEAVIGFMDVVGMDKQQYGAQQRRGVEAPLMGAAAAPSQCQWEWGDDGL